MTICPRPRDEHYRERQIRRMNLGGVDGRSDAVQPPPSVPVSAQTQAPLGFHIGIVQKGLGPNTGDRTTPYPIPMAGQILAVELVQLGTMTVDAVFRVAPGGSPVTPDIILPAGTGTSVYLAAYFGSVVPPDYVQLVCVSGGNGMADLGGYMILVP